jgi:hypothetical protein
MLSTELQWLYLLSCVARSSFRDRPKDLDGDIAMHICSYWNALNRIASFSFTSRHVSHASVNSIARPLSLQK